MGSLLLKRDDTRRNQISSFGEKDEFIQTGMGVSSVDYWQLIYAHQR
jgi:hypothetical protein